MTELHWLLAIVGVVIVVAVYIYSRYQSHAKNEQEFSHTPPSSDPLTSDSKKPNIDIPSLRIKISETEPREQGLSEIPKPISDTPGDSQDSRPVKQVSEKPLLVILHVWACAGQNWQGEQLMEAAQKVGLKATDKRIFQYFHQTNDTTPLFHVADKTEPGTFEWNRMELFKTQGVSLFMELPIVFCSAEEAFLLMRTCAERLADLLSGEILDQSHKPIEQETIDQIHQQCRAIDDRL